MKHGSTAHKALSILSLTRLVIPGPHSNQSERACDDDGGDDDDGIHLDGGDGGAQFRAASSLSLSAPASLAWVCLASFSLHNHR